MLENIGQEIFIIVYLFYKLVLFVMSLCIVGFVSYVVGAEFICERIYERWGANTDGIPCWLYFVLFVFEKIIMFVLWALIAYLVSILLVGGTIMLEITGAICATIFICMVIWSITKIFK